MPTPAQLGIGGAAVTGVVLGGYTIYVVTSSEGEKLVPVAFNSKTFESEHKDYQGKLLSLIKRDNIKLLVVPKPKVKDLEDINKKWWDFAFKKKFNNSDKSALDPIFDSVTSAYAEAPIAGPDKKQTSLNQACHIAYVQEPSAYKFDTNLLKNISDFCTVKEESVDISEPNALLYLNSDQTATEYKTGVLSIEEIRTKLVKKENTNNNDKWWEWAFKNLLKDELKKAASDSFKHVTKPYAATSEKSGTNEITLNHACDEAYKKNREALEKDKNQLFNEIKKFCSPYQDNETWSLEKIEPSTINKLGDNNATQISTGVGAVSGNKSKLVDPLKDNNKKWWEWSFNTRYPKDSKEKDGLHDVFKSVKEAYSSAAVTESSKPQTALNQACKLAYEKNKTDVTSSTGNKNLKTLIKKYCSPGYETTDLEDPAS